MAGTIDTHREALMTKKPHPAPALAIVAGLGAMTLARDEPADKGKPTRKTLSERDIAEKLDGKKAKATTVEVTLEPDRGSAPQRHPGPVFGYVLEGEYEWAIDDHAVRTLKAGDTFYEPTNCLHRVSRNPSDKARARVLAVVLHPSDATDIVLPEKPAKEE
jgi:quercetin dioxygenase-like cupin family protein